MEQIRLRPHHMYCIPQFSGMGYSETFTKRMEDVIYRLDAGETFLLCAGRDVLCEACPYDGKEKGCLQGEEDVCFRDENAREALGLFYGKTYTWEEILACHRQVGKPAFTKVCGGCTWEKKQVCSFSLLCSRISQK